jgi:tetratricopeptide (TPR) repeat protein
MRRLISLGEACEVAFQLRQHSGDNTAHLFDWQTTPVAGLIDLVESGLSTPLPEELHLLKPGTRLSAVLHGPTGIRYVHQFPRRGKVIPAEFLADYPAFASRFEHLAARLRATLREHPVTLVRRGVSRAEALRLEDAMRRAFPSADMRFLYVNASGAPFETPLGRAAKLVAPDTPFGDSFAWAELLGKERLVGAPFRLAPAQIVRGGTDNQLEEADGHPLAYLMEGRRINPDNPWFPYELGWNALRRRRHRRATAFAREALDANPDNPDFIELVLRANVARRRLPRETALRQALLVLDVAEHPGLLTLSVDLALALGWMPEALDLAERGLRSELHSDGLHLRKAQALFAGGRLQEADAAVDEALALHPDGKAYVALKAKTLTALGRTGEARWLLSDVLSRKPSIRLRMLQAGLMFSGVRWRRRRVPSASPDTASGPAAPP